MIQKKIRVIFLLVSFVVVSIFSIYYLITSYIIDTEFDTQITNGNMITYSKEWFKEPLKNVSTEYLENCQVCKFPVRNFKFNSQKTDFLMTVLLNNFIGLMPLSRTIRATGTKARVFIFMDTDAIAKLNQFEKQVLNNCSIDIIDVGNIGRYPHYAYCFIRFYIYYDFLKNLPNEEISRVILFDGQDVIFQGDPFYEGFTSDQLILTVEDRLIHESRWAKRTYKKYFKKIKADLKLYYRPMINAGIALGGKKTIMAFIEAFTKRFSLEDLSIQVKKMQYVDQAIVHALIYDGDLEKQYGIRVSLVGTQSPYASISLGCWGKKCARLRPNDYRVGYFHMRNKKRYQFILHQYNRYPELIDSYRAACPMLGGENKKNYLKGLEKA
ncbi:hypothetical protein TRFO_28159 [Tritrichomonas foetus]|uniref:Nucleotide-diphospho-sugar transferase domain-containing protein n=1 Tax=Tritrichomonas foetus TaxID=1144522 RepID=A0A1J4JYU5_9EUKA|nr:hypothetical protein TRFO_28159 [Tritrichomonas foetus]|eukprot:OHT04335.1 hypothetical protein TRFO_28159 [Tritrichomonas foetus]